MFSSSTRSNVDRAIDLQKSLLEGSHRGRDEYLVTLQDIYALMVKQPKEFQVGNRKTGNRGGQSNFMFAMVGKDGGDVTNNDEEEMVPGMDGGLLRTSVMYAIRKGIFCGITRKREILQVSCLLEANKM